MTLDEITECIKEVKEDYWEDDGYGYATADCQRITTALDEAMKRLEQTRWIPVSERLPKEDNEVLITIKSCGKLYVCHSVYRDGLFWQKNFEFNSYRNPIAWMPLPDPYNASPTKAESEERDEDSD